jgi:hypothetical protein
MNNSAWIREVLEAEKSAASTRGTAVQRIARMVKRLVLSH